MPQASVPSPEIMPDHLRVDVIHGLLHGQEPLRGRRGSHGDGASGARSQQGTLSTKLHLMPRTMNGWILTNSLLEHELLRYVACCLFAASSPAEQRTSRLIHTKSDFEGELAHGF